MRNHLLSRYFLPERYSGVVVTDLVVTLPLWTVSGQWIGYQTYCPAAPKVHKRGPVNPLTARYYTYCSAGQLAMWGVETLNWGDRLFLTEGVFDACRLHWRGLNAVAVISNNPVHLREWLWCYPGETVAAVQGDAAGRRLKKWAHHSVTMPPDQDVGSISELEFDQLFAQYL